MGKLLKQSRRLIPVLLVTFLGFLAQPQVATLHHTHDGDEHPHVHADLLLLPASFHTHEHPHSHPHTHAHSHPHHHSESSHPHTIHTQIPPHTPLLLLPAHSSDRSHWHTASTFHLPGSIAATSDLPKLTRHFLLIAAQPFLLLPQQTTPRSRAPPLPT